jgi:hypothetical protein
VSLHALRIELEDRGIELPCKKTLRHLNLAIAALRRSCLAHRMLRELEQCRTTLMKLDKSRYNTPDMYAEWGE